MKMLKSIGLLAVLMLTSVFASAETISPLEETMFSSGKMPVVMAVAAVILVGIFVYLFVLDRKIGKLEKEAEKK
ncbi:CcmD family protein [Sanyastnella coralliicola]|uniref:CcmD family protein n=1 Tax=Sanyastnella coralliicola TaxID=3069118 RepID=UPI0027B9D91D|nr:CcmD family protein [Longitalea sp. SCSIO 12813]